MTYHSSYNTPCKCGHYFIPYKEGVKCPQCGAENETYDIVSEVIEAAKMHKEKYGSLLTVYSVQTLGDHYIYQSLKFLDDPEFKRIYKDKKQEKHWEEYFVYMLDHCICRKADELGYQGKKEEARGIWNKVFKEKDLAKVDTNDLFLALFFEYRRGLFGFDRDDEFIDRLKEELKGRDF